MTDSVNYQHFENLVEAYERAHSEKKKNISKTAVGNVWKKMNADFPAAAQLEEVVRGQAKESKILSFTNKSKMTDFWSKEFSVYKKWKRGEGHRYKPLRGWGGRVNILP